VEESALTCSDAKVKLLIEEKHKDTGHMGTVSRSPDKRMEISKYIGKVVLGHTKKLRFFFEIRM
jgi:hypothetical protein